MKIVEVSGLDEYRDIISKYSKWMVIISADWCKPCQKVKIFYEDYFNKMDDESKIIIKINYDNLDEFEDLFEVNKIPLFISIFNNNVLKKIQTTDEDKLNDLFNDFCGKTSILDNINEDF